MVLEFTSFVTTFAGAVCSVIFILYLFIRWSFSYWEKRNVATLQPSFPFGNFGATFMSRLSIAELTQDLYNATDKPIVGIYSLYKPILMLRDPNLVKQIMVNDFSTFMDRGVYIDEVNDPISGHLFSMYGEKWRKLRTKLSPTFSTGKLKIMFPTFVECSDRLEGYLDDQVERGIPIDARELLARYATDIIASVAFGIDVDCINNPDTDFRKMGRQIFAPTLKNGVKNSFSFLFPTLAKLFGLRTVDSAVEKFLYDVVKSNMEHREKNNVVRKDFFQMLLQLRNDGKVGLDENWDGTFSESSIKNLTLDEMVAQTFVFYVAGFETTSTTMSFCLFELSKNPDTQRKVQEEINEVLARHDGKVTFESVGEMQYLDMCVDETLRLYPPVPVLNRETNKEYRIPGTNIDIEPKTSVFIPAYALHHDAKYFPKPEEFIPERFENSKDMADKPYYPFGDGPRICIGMRMGKLQTKVGLAVMLKNTFYELAADTPRKLKFDPKNILIGPIGRLKLNGTKLKGL